MRERGMAQVSLIDGGAALALDFGAPGLAFGAWV